MPRITGHRHSDARAAAIASMRPRRDAADNDIQPRRVLAGGDASMRPRRDAADNDVTRYADRSGKNQLQ